MGLQGVQEIKKVFLRQLAKNGHASREVHEYDYHIAALAFHQAFEEVSHENPGYVASMSRNGDDSYRFEIYRSAEHD